MALTGPRNSTAAHERKVPMNSFVRFVSSILIAGGAVNLLIVRIANAHSRNVQEYRTQTQKQQFAKIVDQIQRLPPPVLTSSSNRNRSMPTKQAPADDASRAAICLHQRATRASRCPSCGSCIPGNEVAVDGVVLEASGDFKPPINRISTPSRGDAGLFWHVPRQG